MLLDTHRLLYVEGERRVETKMKFLEAIFGVILAILTLLGMAFAVIVVGIRVIDKKRRNEMARKKSKSPKCLM
jgi:hypothetical protein